MRRPSPGALETAEIIERRLRGRTQARERTHAPIRRRFIERADTSKPTPLASALRGGRGGAVRLKLELSFLWFAAKPPHDLAYPARAWATLLDLDDPAGRGARRINEAILWLERHQLISVESRAGQPNVVTLLSETGTGDPYELPGAAYNRLRNKKPRDLAEEHRYIQLPNELWTKGWIPVLSGAAVAMLLVLYTELGSKNPEHTDLWFSPRQAELRYGLSEDTRSKGLRELRAAELITARRQPIAPDNFDFQRLRNVYRLEPQRLQDTASLPEEIKPPPPLTPTEALTADLIQHTLGRE
jgi:hypothetical protein